MRLSRKEPTWIPASETRGEGIFFQFSEKAIQKWFAKTKKYDEEFFDGHKRWRASKELPNPESGYPGLRFILLHTFAHAVIRQLAIECGYTTASIAERLYSRSPSDGDPMAGVLIYTQRQTAKERSGGCAHWEDPTSWGGTCIRRWRGWACVDRTPCVPNMNQTGATNCTERRAMPVPSCRKPVVSEGTNIWTVRCW